MTEITVPDRLNETGDAVHMQLLPLLDFGDVIKGLKRGGRFTRREWDGSKGLFIFLVQGSSFQVNREPLLSILGEGTAVGYCGHIDIMVMEGVVAVWTPSQLEMLAEDWIEVIP
jgi:hypothetical protein